MIFKVNDEENIKRFDYKNYEEKCKYAPLTSTISLKGGRKNKYPKYVLLSCNALVLQ